MAVKPWESYEQVAAFLLNHFADHFGLGKFEGKQVVPGDSGTDWEIDAKGISLDGEHFVVVECKRYTKGGVPQAIAAGLAWQIQDTGATAGILVTPIGLQDGAKKVASRAGITEVVLDQNSTTTDYVMKFLNRVCLGFSETVNLSIEEELTITIRDKDGNIIKRQVI